jgi:hypothetical protein
MQTPYHAGALQEIITESPVRLLGNDFDAGIRFPMLWRAQSK